MKVVVDSTTRQARTVRDKRRETPTELNKSKERGTVSRKWTPATAIVPSSGFGGKEIRNCGWVYAWNASLRKRGMGYGRSVDSILSRSFG